MANDITETIIKGKLKQKVSDTAVNVMHPETQADVVTTTAWACVASASTDTNVIAGKKYYSKSSGSTYTPGRLVDSSGYKYTLVTNPTGSPKTQGYYEVTTMGMDASNAQSALEDIDSRIGTGGGSGGTGIQQLTIGNAGPKSDAKTTFTLAEIGAQAYFSDGEAIIAEADDDTDLITFYKVGQSSGSVEQGDATTVSTYGKTTISNLKTRVDNLEGRGRFLSTWNCVTGIPATEPTTEGSYVYKQGDYYIVSATGTQSTKNFNMTSAKVGTGGVYPMLGEVSCPNIESIVSCTTTTSSAVVSNIIAGISAANTVTVSAICSSSETTVSFTLIYMARATTLYRPKPGSYVHGEENKEEETDSVQVNDTYIYDGSVWILQKNTTKSVSWSSITGTPTTLQGYGIDDDDAKLQLRAKQIKSGKNASGNDIESGVCADGIIELGDALSAAISTYSVVQVNKKGIVIAGGQSLAVVDNSPTTIPVVDGGWYFEKDAA